MKNIHVLPTDKPSRLHLGNSGLVLCDLNFGKNTINGQNIYITSDEEIKEKTLIFCSKENRVIVNQYHTNIPITYKKIILTTDQDLINDGVQAIDDEFLEWFVENPSCESVEVEKWTDYKFQNNKEIVFFNYKIIIPQEEPKQETLDFKVWDELFGILAWKFQPTKSGDMYLDAEKVFEELKSKFKLEKL